MTKRFELDSSMDDEELATAIEEAILAREEEDATTTTTTNDTMLCCDELHLNCIDINLDVATAVTRLILSSKSRGGGGWKSIELEECTGRVDFIMSVIMTHAIVRRVKVTTFGLDRLDETTLFAIAVGMQQLRQRHHHHNSDERTTTINNTSSMSELILSATLTEDDAQILAEGIAKTTTLRRLCLLDSNLDQQAAETLASQGFQYNTSLHEFGLVACGQSDEWLETLLQSFRDHPCLERLDLRCLGMVSGNLAPVASLLEHKTCGLTSIDLSFKGGCVDVPLDLTQFATALQNRNVQGLSMKLQHLHLCSLLLTDDDMDCVMDACIQASSTLETLNLSLNKITDVGIVHSIAPKIANNELRLKNIYLDGNAFHKNGASALRDALKTNTNVEKIRIPTQYEEIQHELDYYGRLNRGGRRLVFVRGKEHDGNRIHCHDNVQQSNSNTRVLSAALQLQPICIPIALWSFVLGRANRLNFENMAYQVDVIYCLLRNGPLMFPV